jgi:MSHA pilin protein MshA
MNKQAGFTLIELVAVLVILALLGAMAVPRFSDMQDDALEAAKNGSSMAVKSAHTIAIAKLRALPNVTELAGYVGGEAGATAVEGGIEVTIGGDPYIVPTFGNTTCTGAATGPVTDTVACVGSIP